MSLKADSLATNRAQSSRRIAYIFKAGREERISGSESERPTEFFYGYPQLCGKGFDASLVTDAELNLDGRPSWFMRGLNHLVWRIFGIPFWAAWQLAKPSARARLASFDAIIVTTNAFGISLAALTWLGLLNCRLIYIAMGLIEASAPRRIIWVYRRLLRNTTVLSLGRRETAFLAETFPKVTVRYLPFGIDDTFWHPGVGEHPDSSAKPYVLSIGNDRHRDYETLIRAWKAEYPALRIVTRLPIDCSQAPANVEVIHGDWYRQSLDDREIRSLMRQALFVVLPLKNTMQPSGQSACLQAMACGKAVVLSDIDGLWDRDRMKDGDNCILVKAADAAALGRTVEGLAAEPDKAAAIGRRARDTIELHFTTRVMADRLIACGQL